MPRSSPRSRRRAARRRRTAARAAASDGKKRLDPLQPTAITDLGAHRLAAGRQLTDRADLDVAVEGRAPGCAESASRSGPACAAPARRPSTAARRAAATPNRCCSSVTASPRRRKTTAVADHRVGPDHDLGLAGLDRGVDPLTVAPRAASRKGTRRARRAASSSGASPAWCCRARISVGAMSAACHPARTARGQRDRGHRRLAAANVTLQQPAHRSVTTQVGDDLVDGGPLVAGELERQRSDERRELGRADRHLCGANSSSRASRACARVSCRARSSSNARRSRAADHVDRLLRQVRVAKRTLQGRPVRPARRR